MGGCLERGGDERVGASRSLQLLKQDELAPGDREISAL